MRVLNIMQCTNLGGMEQSSLRLMRALMQRGHECRVLSLHPLGDLGSLLDGARIPAEGLRYRGPAGMGGLWALRRRIAALDGESDSLLMTGHNLMAMFAMKRTSSRRRVLAMHIHHAGVKSRWAWRVLYSAAVRRFDVIAFPSCFVRNEAIELHPPVERISRVIRYPLELPELTTPQSRAESRRELSLPAEEPVIGNAGWLIPRKRWDVFLRTAAAIHRLGIDARFVIAGDGPERNALRDLASQLGLAQRVVWLGWQRDLTAFYRSIDVLLFHSDWDALPVTPQEAMAFGVPVVATIKQGGLKELFSLFKPGFLADNHDVEWCADKVASVLADRESAARLGRQGREGIGRVSEPDRIAAEYEECLGPAEAAA